MAELDPKYINKIICCDCIEGMKQLPDDCIPLTVTSPPYDDLREFGGGEFDFEGIAQELFRVTMEGGIVVWVVAEQIKDGSESGTTSEQRLFFRDIGFRLHATMVMAKTVGRFPHKTRYAPNHDLAFVLSKGEPRAVNKIRDRRNSTAGERKKRWNARKRDGRIVKDEHEFVVPEFGVRGSVWYYNVGSGHTTKDKKAFEHPALMPEEMAEDHIISWSHPGDLVFDPMAGAGTTCKMAHLNNRRYLGMEAHEEYCVIARERLQHARENQQRRLDEFFFDHESWR